jgi:hypothetical protein
MGCPDFRAFTFIDLNVPKPSRRTVVSLPRPWAILALCLVAIVVLFGAPAEYPPTVHALIVSVALLASVAALWFAGASSVVRPGADDTLRLRAAGAALLVAPFILFALLPGVGPPREQPAQDNELRFLLLAIDPMCVCAGLLLLKEASAGAGDRLYGTVSLAAIGLATPLYVAFALVQRIDYVAVEMGYTWAASVSGHLRELTALDAFSMAALFLGSALTYIATAAFARSLTRVGWLSRGAAVVVQTVCGVGLALLLARGFAYPSPHAAFSSWYTIPGFIAGIPAVPWIPPCAIGVLILRRVGLERDATAAGVSAPARRAPPSMPT